MLLLLLFQVVLSSLALARQADVDMQLHDAWGRAAYEDQPLIQKIEKTVCVEWMYCINLSLFSLDAVGMLRFMTEPYLMIVWMMMHSGFMNHVGTSWEDRLSQHWKRWDSLVWSWRLFKAWPSWWQSPCMGTLLEEGMVGRLHDFMRLGPSFVKVKFPLFNTDKYLLLILLSL